MISYPNQKVVSIKRNMPNKKQNKDNNPFLLVYCSSFKQASKNLKGQVAFKLWLYLVSNAEGFTIAFSPKAVHEQMGVSQDAVRDAFKQLVQNRYLIKDEEGKNRFTFYEHPFSSIVAKAGKRLFLDDNNNDVALTYKELLKQVNYNQKLAREMWNQAEIAKGE